MMSSILSGSLLGLALGVRHSLEPDHLAAVGTFVSRTAHPGRAAVIGALWGAGHSVSLLVLGALVLALRGHVPDWLDSLLESLVGVMLIALGVRAILSARFRNRVRPGHEHTHEHEYGRIDAHIPAPLHAPIETPLHPFRAALPPFAVGLGHGIAGTGGAVLLATATMPNAKLGVLFLGLFGAGSVLGMALLASLLNLTIHRANARLRGQALRLPAIAGVFSVVIGAWWIIQQHL
ncbi:MAG: hypothetical protein H6729_16935 [Deltaproteobacteria bacterium]|nr:hypothetical protein [Deltaproteobacteria bacterium]